ncbi:phosphoglycerate mutase-like protein [Mycena maculata]|uniref:Phosphoglycerate mutase-like protein n=1 Tax=Mycena maculata TaxID=230809 RepID=A0AAD7N7C4_9AGAR|nr:phosphoglycerate mutase-like protein [Mycena maculata]
MISLVTALLLASTAAVKSSPTPVASTFAGATSSAIWPPPGAASLAEAEASFFPDATQIDVFGPTPTGDEAFAIETAPSSPDFADVFPLVEPATADQKSFDVLHSWGNLGPFQSSSLGLKSSPKVPEGCSLTQVHLLHRHGARYPTSGSAPASFAAALHNAAANGTVKANGPLAFLNTWNYKLGAEILTPFGREQLFELGTGFRVKYGDLLKGFTKFPVWRTTSEERMVDSALHFAAGFFGVQAYQTDYNQLIDIETPGFNCTSCNVIVDISRRVLISFSRLLIILYTDTYSSATLAPYDMCPNSVNTVAAIGAPLLAQWQDIYLKEAQDRLNKDFESSTGLTLNTTWLYAMQQLCAYETVALGYSSFCDLFTEAEWEGFEYSVDLSFWYDNGPGNPAVAAQGVGWVQELTARLTQSRASLSPSLASTINQTIVQSNITFPLDQPIYVDATHDTVISTIVVAMNFTSMTTTGPLPATHIPTDRSYKVNQISPFAANLVGQVLSCPAQATSTAPTHIRWLLNDATVPLTGIDGCPFSEDGLCPFDTFVSGMQKRIQEIDFEFGCFGNMTGVTAGDLITGQLPASQLPTRR